MTQSMERYPIEVSTCFHVPIYVLIFMQAVISRCLEIQILNAVTIFFVQYAPSHVTRKVTQNIRPNVTMGTLNAPTYRLEGNLISKLAVNNIPASEYTVLTNEAIPCQSNL